MVEAIRHNWTSIIKTLEQHFTPYAIAKVALGGDQNKLKRIKDGLQPKHFEGELLLAMHSDVSHETTDKTSLVTERH